MAQRYVLIVINNGIFLVNPIGQWGKIMVTLMELSLHTVQKYFLAYPANSSVVVCLTFDLQIANSKLT